MDEGYNTAAELLHDLRYQLNNLNSWYVPIFVDGKQVKKGSIDIIRDADGNYKVIMETI